MFIVTSMPAFCPETKRPFRGCSPRYHPYRWLVVNGVVLLWSAVLLVLIFATKGSYDDNETRAIELHYLLYNFVTSGVWLLEVFFNVLDFNEFFDREGERGESLLRPTHETESAAKVKLAIWIEGGLSACFFVDSTAAAVHLSRNEIHVQAGSMTMTIWVFVNMASFAFMVYRMLLDWRTMKQSAKQMELVSALHSTTLV